MKALASELCNNLPQVSPILSVLARGTIDCYTARMPRNARIVLPEEAPGEAATIRLATTTDRPLGSVACLTYLEAYTGLCQPPQSVGRLRKALE